MTDQKYLWTLICVFLCSILRVISADEACDKSKCPGPLQYYADLNCTPIYSTPNSCCAVEYNCDHLKGRSTNKCYINGNVYELGAKLKDEDARPCDIGCTCTSGYDGFATFNCAVVDCFQEPPHPGCYRKNSPANCCPGEEVCPKNPSDRARCEVDGKTYLDGQYFTVQSDTTLSCVCQPGYEGKNVEPFCRPGTGCRVELRGASDIYFHCPPVYYSSQSPATDCSVFSRCQNANDTVISEHNSAEASEPGRTCEFGNMTMQRGDELNMATDYSSVCVKCVCEVPPIPTCQRLPDEECDVTRHPPFAY